MIDDEKINRIDAAVSLGFHNFHGPEGGDWVFPDGETPPTEEAIQKEIIRLQAEHDAQEYARNRQTEYPPILDYIDGVVKDDQTQIDKYIEDCKAIKAKYPKP